MSRALKLFADMQESSLQPKNKHLQCCYHGLRERQAVGRGYAICRHEGLKPQPDVITYSAAIIACEIGRQWAEDLQLFAEIKDSSLQPNVITYSDAISNCKQDEQG